MGPTHLHICKSKLKLRIDTGKPILNLGFYVCTKAEGQSESHASDSYGLRTQSFRALLALQNQT